jgi:hypothetical protein
MASKISIVSSNKNGACISHFVVVSYNLHGYNQGCPGIKDIIKTLSPDVIMVQEHWLYSSNLSKLNDISSEYFYFGSSAMDDCVSVGPFYGRPFGGTAIMIKKTLTPCTANVVSCDRFSAIKIANWLMVSVYMPCSGTDNRQSLYVDILQEIQALLYTYPDCDYLIGGDFNVNLDCSSLISNSAGNFISSNNLHRCDVLFPVANKLTYVNESLHCANTIDYMITSNPESTIAFNILDIDVNLSDHLPIMTVCRCDLQNAQLATKPKVSGDVFQLRWDHAPLHLYYENTRLLLQPILDDLNSFDECYSSTGNFDFEHAERLYEGVVNTLQVSADLFIPKSKKNFYKFWWSQEIDVLKENAVKSCRIWKDAAKPRYGPIYNNYRHDKLLYKKRIKEEQAGETTSFTNDLHDALLRKSGRDFWKIWKSICDKKKNNVVHVNGISDCATIANNFAEHYERNCTPFSTTRNEIN